MPHSPHLAPEEIVAALQWRYAVKKFDPSRKIPANLWTTLETALVLAPSSYGLQPWKFVVITRQSLKDELVAHSYGQRQVVDASHLVVLAARRSVQKEDVDAYIGRIEEVRGSSDFLPKFRQRLLGDLVEGPRAAVSGEWATQQTFIALGQLLATAALLGVDVCPMGGFSGPEYDRILGLEQKGYRSIVLAAAGYRSEDDITLAQPKVRFSPARVVEHFT